GLGLAAEQYGAQYFGTGATLSGVLNLPEEPGPEAIQELRDQFKRRHGGISKSHAIGILTGGATWTPLSVKPEESQFLETRRFTDVQIAHGFGVPPEYVTEAEGVKGYVTGLYARQYTWMTTGINPRLVRLERKLSALLPGDDYIRFNRNAFLAMDPQERAQFYNQGLLGRWIVPNEIREKEDKDPLPGGDDPLWSVQWQPVE
ncbi:MAG: phage portal protein, partial [Candidatus Margulisbacteria bacterium]|nr:phage portal protein [Candidatus Margulisiibacteriota bacterium]